MVCNPIDHSELSARRRLPIYLLLDCSSSMTGEPIEAIRNGVTALIADLKSNPQTLETAWISIIVFGADAWQIVPLTELISFPLIFPIIDLADESALGAALMVLDRAIDRELIRRTATNPGDYCPLVVILIDGMPSDDWESAATLLIRRHKLGGMLLYGAGPQVTPAKLAASIPGMVGVELASARPEVLTSFLSWLDQDDVTV
jgi:uncharacterized protein YegL